MNPGILIVLNALKFTKLETSGIFPILDFQSLGIPSIGSPNHLMGPGKLLYMMELEEDDFTLPNQWQMKRVDDSILDGPMIELIKATMDSGIGEGSSVFLMK
jgi:hypothetical protein